MKSQLGFPQGDKLSVSITELSFSQSSSRRIHIQCVSVLPVESLSLSKMISTLYSLGTQCFFNIYSALSPA